MKKYLCVPCGYIYDPDEGDPENDILPGTAFEEFVEYNKGYLGNPHFYILI